MNFDLLKPCAECPFAKKCRKGWLGERRAADIANGIAEDDTSTFTCHKTDRESRFSTPETTDQTQHCGGATLFLMNLKSPNVLMRLAFAFGKLKPAHFTEQNKQKVFDSVESFIKHHS